jgi:hypothetical protein
MSTKFTTNHLQMDLICKWVTIHLQMFTRLQMRSELNCKWVQLSHKLIFKWGDSFAHYWFICKWVLTHLQTRIHLHMRFNSFANGLDSFANESSLICKWAFPANLFYNLLQKFAFGPNWVWRKELFLTLTISIWKVSFFYLCEYLLKEVKSEDFGLNWVWQIESFLYFSHLEEIANMNNYYPSKTFSEKSDQAEFDSYLVWCLNTFWTSTMSVRFPYGRKNVCFYLLYEINLLSKFNGAILEKNVSGGSSRKLQILDT